MKSSKDERRPRNRKVRLSENPLKNEERRQNKKTKREVAQLLDEKELPDEQQVRKVARHGSPHGGCQRPGSVQE